MHIWSLGYTATRPEKYVLYNKIYFFLANVLTSIQNALLLFLQLNTPWISMMVPTNDAFNSSNPVLPLLLRKGVILPQDVLLITNVRGALHCPCHAFQPHLKLSSCPNAMTV